MDTDDQHIHFAWDLLDSAKRVTRPQGVEEQNVDKQVAPEPPPLPFSEPDSTGQLRSMPEAEASLMVGSEPPAMDGFTGKSFTVPLRLDPPPEKQPPGEPEPVPVKLPVTGHPARPARSDGDVPKLSWIDVGRSTEPGQYGSRYGLVEVRAQDIRIWKMHPHAAFAVMQPSPYSERNVSWLGSFDLGDRQDFTGLEK